MDYTVTSWVITIRATRCSSGEIKTSKTPYYYMEDLADIEEERGHKDAALEWLARSYKESQGQATRFQWGAHYVRGLLRLRPEDEATIGDTSGRCW